ncbi:MAG: PadR family transcriptional regulator [Candidatus Alcyoniella australis]|nr:PadR family transcriptional regulator [Candidatus Alcyoniella australis]
MSIKYVILGLLQNKDLHGYRIKQIIERDFGAMWTINFGQIYPALSAMHKERLVSMTQVPQPAAPPRKLYSITPKGREVFAAWLNSPPERRMVLRDSFLIRFPFFGLGDSQAALQAVQEQIDQYEQELREREEYLSTRLRGSDYARLVAELGLELNQTMLGWLRRAAVELRESDAANSSKKTEQQRAADRATG